MLVFEARIGLTDWFGMDSDSLGLDGIINVTGHLDSEVFTDAELRLFTMVTTSSGDSESTLGKKSALKSFKEGAKFN